MSLLGFILAPFWRALKGFLAGFKRFLAKGRGGEGSGARWVGGGPHFFWATPPIAIIYKQQTTVGKGKTSNKLTQAPTRPWAKGPANLGMGGLIVDKM